MDAKRRKNRWKTIIPENQNEKWSPNQELFCVAHFPDISMRGQPLFSAGRIILRYGKHSGPNHGFGFEHIWKEHCGAFPDHDEAMKEVERRVRNVIQPGTGIYYEAGSKAAIFSSQAGLAIVEQMTDGQNSIFYSVVTVFRRPNVNGSRVGAVLEAEPVR